MNLLRIRLTMRGPTATPWQADTIWGHLAWGLAYNYGEDALAEVIEQYRRNEPPLLLSDGFPGDVLPRPLVPMGMTAATSLAEEKQALETAREARKPGYVAPSDFARALRGEPVPLARGTSETGEQRAMLKNAINRSLGIAAEGQLYTMKEYFWPQITVYARVSDVFAATAKDLFEYLRLEGYGKRRSTGYGAIDRMDIEPVDEFDAPPDANGFVSLSSFVPAAADPTQGWWRLRVKHGRLGEHFAYGPNPFKRPLVMLEAGSTFYDSKPRAWYGRIVEEVSPAQPQVIHYGFALAVPMRLPDQG
ncbi:MAG: hypothetical protein QME79_11965 [Bacillota bacterium]|nr:hypothetical protein [Bacillota bacterium]